MKNLLGKKRCNKIYKKQGFEMAISTLVVIVLGLIVLIALSMAFTGGWKKFYGKLMDYNVGEIDSLEKICKNSCVLENKNDFCCVEREISFVKAKTEKIKCTDERLKVECSIDCEGVCENG
ncbi:MAG: hypothetical protein KJ559_02555 [Nanoarchaeota archaeon]|nr:hypothetical protein [Nanoarchaeota archaeon]